MRRRRRRRRRKGGPSPPVITPRGCPPTGESAPLRQGERGKVRVVGRVVHRVATWCWDITIGPPPTTTCETTSENNFSTL